MDSRSTPMLRIPSIRLVDSRFLSILLPFFPNFTHQLHKDVGHNLDHSNSNIALKKLSMNWKIELSQFIEKKLQKWHHQRKTRH